MHVHATESDGVEVSLNGFVYNNEKILPWSEEYRNACGASYDQIVSQLKETVQRAIAGMSIFSPPIKNSRDGR
ncbi:unnamed protein product [Fasciola hepatica]|uniref:DUF4160 domain-containing protein n=1 Tax=Fasciola hepatica TaxID=6192 RepID=A0ABC9HF07_FASHE